MSHSRRPLRPLALCLALGLWGGVLLAEENPPAAITQTETNAEALTEPPPLSAGQEVSAPEPAPIDDRWLLCPPLSSTLGMSFTERNAEQPVETPANEQAVHLSADRVTAQTETAATFSGNVIVIRQQRRIEGDEATYDRNADRLDVQGNVRLFTNQFTAEGDSATFELAGESAELHNARYFFPEAHAFVTAGRIGLIDPEHSELEQATYTTCNPDQQDWLLDAERIELDETSNTGEAYDVTVEFKGVPFFYSPYLNFPLHGRKSGLLVPEVGISETEGTDIRIPYYWNIAPHRDATLTPRNITSRGAMLLSEFRYLNPASGGQINYDVMPDDKRYGDERSFVEFLHQSNFGNGWSGSMAYREVSDIEYFDDLDDSRFNTTQSHLQRRLNLLYRGSGWSFSALAQDFQSLTETASPQYQRLPQLRLSAATPRRPNTLQAELNSELVYFDHETNVPTGQRLDLYPGLSLPLEGAAWFLTPRLALRHTTYDLIDAPTGDTYPERTVPISSLDTGLFFERDLQIGERPLLQTLEPRLYYLYVPYRDQDTFPLFDTTENNFSFAQLFRENRFSGGDRQGDTNQLTAALTTRFLDLNSGAELLRASIGQIAYLENREVTLKPNRPADIEPNSDIVGELAATPHPAWELSATDRWDTGESRSVEESARVRYHADKYHVVGLDYRVNREKRLTQYDLTVFWPLTRRWRFLGRWNYDQEIEETLEGIAGLEYESCCWILRLVKRDRVDPDDLEIDRTLYLSLELKGLTSIGRRLEKDLEEDILGYN